MNKDDLLRPRIKLIAPVPFFDNKTGSILDSTDEGIFIDPSNDEKTSCLIRWGDVKNYPHLFSSLSWWEEREISELPEYVKYGVGYYKVVQWRFKFGTVELDQRNGHPLEVKLHHCLPSSVEEFNNFNEKK